ncbi:uncharacterized protein LOC119659920 isoform X3 [Hermetia illucens]|uniref:uncharacterized protein LOC119659920 isoform X3 n=1 Tax=Hermetia illucens TaxID=343691 RepID=UPI0018CC4A61|nr:uncharacterized protein LOC119659920 isoform X3 [Hermetia illucens]
MVTCKSDLTAPKMVTSKTRRASSTSSGFRLLDGDQLDNISSVSRNSIYKLKIDSMFDDSRSIISQRLDDRRGSHRTASIIMYGRRSDFTNNSAASNRLLLASSNGDDKEIITEEVSATISAVQKDVRRISNSVQAQIERMFTDVAKDATSCSFQVRCLGSLSLKDKVTSLQGLQDPLRQLYLTGAGQGNHSTGSLDICPKGLRISHSGDCDTLITPFHHIAVWSAVKFVVSPTEGGAAFLPLITDPENIDKSSLFRPLTAADQRRLSSGLHAPIFAVVMRSAVNPKLLECHAFVCQSPEDAIVIAATLYQSLMAHVSSSPHNSTKRRTPRNQNGVSCISIASSSALTNSTPALRSVSKKNSFRGSTNKLPPIPSRPPRKKRTATSSLSGDSDTLREVIETTTEERKKKSHKTKRAPPVPGLANSTRSHSNGDLFMSSMSYLDKQNRARHSHRSSDALYHDHDGSSGDILTRVAIPRSGSFLNTSGLTRYKSRATRRHSGKSGGGGGGSSNIAPEYSYDSDPECSHDDPTNPVASKKASKPSLSSTDDLHLVPLPIPIQSPLGFSELFNEFRLHENLHSLDDILNAIIDADGMSFNDLKPIYKEFLLKLAVTLTKDELYQRSKNIMRRQKKKKLKRKNSAAQLQKSSKGFILSARSLKKVFWFGQFRSCKKPRSKANKATIITTSATSAKNALNAQTATSGSDMSETRNEHVLNAINRNSSSGYVSCSECSYDSEACTCTSADRCYCSLGADHDRVNEKLSKTGVRDSLVSCKTEDKCYCSLGETNEESFETTSCDTDSCISTSKCYCKRSQKNGRNQETVHRQKDHQSKDDKLALDYELFTVGGGSANSRPVKAHEALSVKKSVEVAAEFADVKLSQTTDIKSLTAGTLVENNKASSRRRSSSKKGSQRSSHRSSSTSDIISKLNSIEKETSRKGSIKIPGNDSNYQSMRPVSRSLEDTLGYLP